MGKRFIARWLLAISLAALLFPGCNGGGDSRDAPVGPDLEGDWAGRYYIIRTRDSQEQALTAFIHHDGDAIRIETSLSGLGARFTGTIRADGSMTLIDAFDGETWTTFFRRATPTMVQIADFLFDPDKGSTSPLQTIELNRAPPASAD